MNDLQQWAADWRVPPAALADLLQRLCPPPTPANDGASETRVQGLVRLEAHRRHGMVLWRNNRGVLPNERGTPVRYGLCNDSPEVGRKIRSADLIGAWPRLITPEMVGSTIGQFASFEAKKPGWKFKGDEHELGQLRWAGIVQGLGGVARFISDPGQL